jgi:hypothetical protein
MAEMKAEPKVVHATCVVERAFHSLLAWSLRR